MTQCFDHTIPYLEGFDGSYHFGFERNLNLQTEESSSDPESITSGRSQHFSNLHIPLQ